MKCKLCGRKATEYKKIRNGAVCQSCLNVMPVILSDNDDALKKLTDKQLKNTKRIITKPKNPYFGKIDGIKVGIDAMQINEWEIQYRHIKNIELSRFWTDPYIKVEDIQSKLIMNIVPIEKIY